MNIKLNEHIIDAISCNCISNTVTIYQNIVSYDEIQKHLKPTNDIQILKYDNSIIESYKNMEFQNIEQPDNSQTEMNLIFVLKESDDDMDLAAETDI